MEKFPWHNSYPLDPPRVAQILAADLSDLAVERVEVLGEGWDFATFLVNGEWVFRFPKRRQTGRQLAREYKFLEAVAQPLADQPVAIPRYRYHVSTPVLAPLPYVGYALLRGDPLIDCAVDSVDPVDIGNQLGAFLQRLNAVAPSRRPRIFHDHFPASLIDFRRELEESAVALPAQLARECAALLGRTPPLDEGPPQFQHGDLGAEHILVDRQRGRITAIIDWGDAGWGNSVADLVGLWTWGGDRAVRAALPPWGRSLSDDDWVRLRMWGAAYAIGSAYYGYKDRRDPLRTTALGWLERMQRAGQLADPSTPDA
jgi:aminoglycoside phosphotransferase (APT) family kinase protein